MYETLLAFLLVILSGVIFRRLRVGGIDAGTVRRVINVCVIALFLPCLCLKTFSGAKIGIETVLMPLSGVFAVLFCLLLTYLSYRALRHKFTLTKPQEGVLILGGAFGNVTFLGLPFLSGVYGPDAAIYALYYDLFATTPLLWFIGVQIAAHFGTGETLTMKGSLYTLLRLPPLWGIFFGLLFNISGLELPDFVYNAMDMLGRLVIPLMIFSIGLALEVPKVNHTFIILPTLVIKLVVSPVVAYIVAKALGLSGLTLQATTVEGAMPVMVAVLLIAERFKLDNSFAAFLILSSTLLSFITLPFVVSIV